MNLFKFIIIIKKYFGIILLAGTATITNAYQYLKGHTPWLSDLSEGTGGNMWITIIIVAIVVSLLMKLVRIIFNGIVITCIIALFYFHEPVLAYLNSNQSIIQQQVRQGVQETTQEVKDHVQSATKEGINNSNLQNSSNK